MFVSSPELEFSVPQGLAEPGVKYWRAMRLSVHLPWFVATYLLGNGEDDLMYTICVASDVDLVTMIERTPHATITALSCMTPGWMTHSGRWESRDVAEVWRARAADGADVVLLRDRAGNEFCGSYSGLPVQALSDRVRVASVQAAQRRRRKRM